MQHNGPDRHTDFRTPALDLDNVYGRGPGDQPYMYDRDGKFLLGEMLDNGASDLPRNGANPSRALIGDPAMTRSIVSQFQALMLRFHNRMVGDNPILDFPSLQKLVRWHYQWVIVNDFLPRIIAPSVLEGTQNQRQVRPEKARILPVEKRRVYARGVFRKCLSPQPFHGPSWLSPKR